MTLCVTWSQKAKSPPGCSAVDTCLEELTHARVTLEAPSRASKRAGSGSRRALWAGERAALVGTSLVSTHASPSSENGLNRRQIFDVCVGNRLGCRVNHPVAQGHQCFKKIHQTEHVILIRTKLAKIYWGYCCMDKATRISYLTSGTVFYVIFKDNL